MGELYQSQASSPVTSTVHHTYSAVIGVMGYAGVDLGGGCRGCASPPPQDEAFFVFPFKICLPHRSVTSFLRGAPLLKKNPGSAPDMTLIDSPVSHHEGASLMYTVQSLILLVASLACYCGS